MRRVPVLPLVLCVVAVAAAGVFLAPWLDRPAPVEPGSDVGEGALPPPDGGTPPPVEDGAPRATADASVGRSIEGVVRTAAGAPVQGATVEVDAPGEFRPPSFAAPEPVTSLGDGAFLLRGVPPGTVRVRARHPAYVDAEVLARPDVTRVTIRLTPALVAWFRVRGPDGRVPEGARVTATSGRFRREQPLAPPAATDPEPPERGLLGPVRVPADTGAETLFEVAIPGFEPWSIDDDAPAGGAIRVYEVGLVRTPPAGRVRLRLRSESGEALAFGRDAAWASLERLDGPAGPPDVPRDVEGDAVFDRVRAGRYRLTVLARGRAPAVAEAVVKADEEATADAILRPEGRARIRVVGNGGKPLTLRLTRDDRPVRVFLEPGERRETTASFAAGEGGTVVGGLAPGPYVVEVIAPDLAPVGARFDAVAGETLDVEVRPSAR